ncbi:MAG: hypothetical protein KBF57_12160 [Saprospiraceae bacterium]|nr:hypothetical protein [Saprospiraceae bacterium]
MDFFTTQKSLSFRGSAAGHPIPYKSFAITGTGARCPDKNGNDAGMLKK